MKTKDEISAYLEQLDLTDEGLEAEIVKHAQLHLLYPEAGHEISQNLAERQQLVVQAKANALEWLLSESGGSIPND